MSGSTRNRRTKEFKDQFDRLPSDVQKLATAAFERFQVDPSHPALRHHALDDNKKGQHRQGSFSVSVTMQYRAIYTTDGHVIVWYWIGTHADYDVFVGKK